MAGQESWEREGENIVVDGYKFGKPCKDQSIYPSRVRTHIRRVSA